MISKNMEKALNDQIALEAKSSFLYLSMATWCTHQGMDGGAEFFYQQAEEERMHMMKIFRYLNEVDGKSIAPKIDKVTDSFKSIHNIFEAALKSEQTVTKSIHQLVSLSEEENDYATHNFLQWYVDEQREEELLMKSILDKIKLIGESSGHLYYVDKELEKLNGGSRPELA